MSENRFKVSKADTDGTKEFKETYRRVNLSTDIQVNIIEPCKCSALYTILHEGIFKMDRDHVWQKYFSFFVTHQLLPTLFFTWWSLFFVLTLRERSAQTQHEVAVFKGNLSFNFKRFFYTSFVCSAREQSEQTS